MKGWIKVPSCPFSSFILPHSSLSLNGNGRCVWAALGLFIIVDDSESRRIALGCSFESLERKSLQHRGLRGWGPPR